MEINRQKLTKIADFILEASVLSAVFLVPLIFSWPGVLDDVFELPKLAVFRSLLWLGAGAILAKFLLAGVSFKFKKIFFILPFLIFLPWFFSCLFSVHPVLSFYGRHSSGQGFLTLFHYLLFFYLLIFNFDSRRKIKRAFWAVLFSSFFVCVYALAQFFLLDPFFWTESQIIFGRVFSSFGQPNFLGNFLIITIPLSVYFLFFAVKKFLLRFFVFILVALELLTLFLTYSRAAWLGFLFGAAVFLVIFLLAKKKKFLAGGLIIAIFVLLLVFIKVAPVLPNNSAFFLRIKSISDIKNNAVKARLNYWQASLEEFKAAPIKRKIFGYGPEALSDIFASRYQAEWGMAEKINLRPVKAHNLFLDGLLSFGVFGFFSYFIFWSFFIFYFLKFLKKQPAGENFWLIATISVSLSACLVNNFFSFSLTASWVYIFLLLGLAVFALSENREGNKINIFWPLWLKTGIFLFFLPLAFCAIFYYNINFVRADGYYSNFLESRSCREAWKYFSQMEKLVFYDNYYRKELALGLPAFCSQDSGVEKEIFKIAGEVLEKVPEKERDFYFFFYAANFYSSFGASAADNELAEKYFNRLIKDFPNFNFIYRNYAYFKIKTGDLLGAKKMADRAEEKTLSPDILYYYPERFREAQNEAIENYFLRAVLAENAAQYPEAIENYKKILKINPYYVLAYKKIGDLYRLGGDTKTARWYYERQNILSGNKN